MSWRTLPVRKNERSRNAGVERHLDFISQWLNFSRQLIFNVFSCFLYYFLELLNNSFHEFSLKQVFGNILNREACGSKIQIREKGTRYYLRSFFVFEFDSYPSGIDRGDKLSAQVRAAPRWLPRRLSRPLGRKGSLLLHAPGRTAILDRGPPSP